MPSLKCTYAEFLDIIIAYGFTLHHQGRGSHQIWRREFDGQVYLVTFAPHQMTANIPTGTLQSMIRQAGLPKKLFRK